MKDLRNRYDKLTAERGLLLIQCQQYKNEMDSLLIDLENYTKAGMILVNVGGQIQETFQEKVESLVTLIISAAFDRPFTFHLRFEEGTGIMKRMICKPVIKEEDVEYFPKDEMGGGILDIIALALRIIIWSLKEPRSRGVFILDEPFSSSTSLMERIGPLLKILSKELKFQLIIVHYSGALWHICDKVWRVTHSGKRSRVKLVKNITEGE